jgi:3D (Asp-Asp-Asp) domain-containing protein
MTYALRFGIGLAVGGVFQAQGGCAVVEVTGYSVQEYPGLTTDGTPTPGAVGAIAAGGHAYPLGAWLWIDGVGARRIADRGHLGWTQVDVLFQSTREAREWGRQQRTVCQ